MTCFECPSAVKLGKKERDVEIHKTVKGGYDTFALTGQLDTAACVELRPWVFHTLEHTVNHICFDLTSLISIDKNGYRFLKNLKKALEPSHRHIAIFGANATLEGEFKSGVLLEGSLNCYPNLHEFENSFTIQYQTIREKLYAVADGSGIIRGLHLRCPMLFN
jgi:anti-anti-sigma regulatory factor